MQRILLATLAIISLAVAATAQVPTDPKIVKAIENKKTELAGVQKKLEAANITLQDLYADLRSRFLKAKSGTDGDARSDLARALSEGLDAAKKATSSGKAANDRDVRKMVRTFEKAMPKAIGRLEHPLLKQIPRLVRTGSVRTVEELAKSLGDHDSDAFAAEAVARIFGQTEFHQVWNGEIVARLTEARSYSDAFKAVAKVEEDLMVLRDPKMKYTIGAPDGMARIPAGSYVVEGTYGFSKKKKLTKVKAFYIDTKEVTHGQYFNDYYVNLTDKTEKELRIPRTKGRGNKTEYLWQQDPATGEYVPHPDIVELPVTGIDAASAWAYAVSQGKRLPTEAEWCAAAAGDPKGNAYYPWGDDYKSELCNDKAAKLEKPQPVSSYPHGRSIWGIYNMAGNVKEWCATSDTSGKDLLKGIPEQHNLVVRGGSYASDKRGVSNRWRWAVLGYYTYEADIGFRCAKDVD